MERITKTEYYKGIAAAVNKRSTCLRRRYGCVIVKNDEIIATGYNGSPRGMENCCDKRLCKRMDKEHNSGDYSECHSVHAEQNALLSARRQDMIGATMYLVGEELGEDGKWKLIPSDKCSPCPICSRMIKNSGIKEVVA